MKVLFDTSIIIDCLRRRNIEQTIFRKLIKETKGAVISLITVGELYSGESAEKKEEEIQEILKMTEIANIDYSLMKTAGEIRRKASVTLIDAIIAATSLNLNLPLATLNEKDFRKVAGLILYKISSAN